MVKVNNPLNKSFNGFVNEFFNDLPTAVGKSLREDVLHYPPVNIEETPDAYFVQLMAAGLSKEDFKVSLESNILTVSSEKKESELAENHKMIRKEFSNRSFKRSFTINEKVEAEGIAAKYENGVMTIFLPKREFAKAMNKEIVIQ